MAIQIRRGASTDFDATKMVSGELGVATDDSHKMWATGQAGDSWELANKEDLDAEVESRETLAETVEEVVETVANKADVNGTYTDMAVGDVVSDKKITDTTPYLFRPSGAVGSRAYETIVGASVGWNQLANRTITSSTSGQMTVAVDSEVITITGSPSSTQIVPLCNNNSILTASHKYLLRGNMGSNSSTNDGSMFIETDGNYFYDKGNGVMFTALANGTKTIGAVFSAGNTYSRKYIPQLTDLTAELGTTIADYIYSLESATAGSGIAKLREWGFLRGYQAYNAGAIESVEVTGKKVVGFNQWDEETRNGYYNTNGVFVQNSGYLACKNLIPVLPNTAYCIACANKNIGRLCFYDSDESFVSTVTATSSVAVYTFTTPSNCYYMAFDMTGSYGTTYNNDICINLSIADRNGEYEPYQSQSYPLGSDVLRGIFKLDSNNRLYADGDVKTSDGVITRKYGVVDLGTLTWTYVSTTGHIRFFANFPSADRYAHAATINCVCSIYETQAYSYVFNNNKTGIAIHTDGTQIAVYDPNYTDAATFKTAMSGVYLVYELATPTTETSTPFTSPQVCYPDGTEEFITENGVPVGHSTDYPYSIKALAEELIDIPEVPTANGTYVLKATRSASGITYAWEVTS